MRFILKGTKMKGWKMKMSWQDHVKDVVYICKRIGSFENVIKNFLIASFFHKTGSFHFVFARSALTMTNE